MALGDRNRPNATRQKVFLLIGYVLLTYGILAGHADPADGYELSIYAGTPAVFWFGIGVALLISVITVIYSNQRTVTALGAFLGGVVIVTTGSLPLIRGYHFYGLSDALTHLGWVRAIATNDMSGLDLIYPGSHLATILIGELGWIKFTHSMMIMVVLSLIAFLVFVPLTLRVLIPEPVAVLIAVFSSFLLLPLNNIGTHLQFHPYTMSAFMSAFILFLLFKHGNGDADDRLLPSSISAVSLVLPIITAAILFTHPQVALNILLFFGTIVAVQYGYRRFHPSHSINGYRTIYGQTLFLAVIFIVWNFQFFQTYNMIDGIIITIWSTLLGTGTAGEVVTQQGGSAAAIGVTLTELFVKMFLLSAIYVIIGVGLVIAKSLHRNREEYPNNRVAISYFGFSGVTLGPFFIVHYFGELSTYFFRHIGFAMVFVTLMGASGLYVLRESLGRLARQLLRPFIVVVIVIMLSLSLLVVFPSPYIFKQNHHASGQLMDGYEKTFKFAPDSPGNPDAEVFFVGIRSGPGRFVDALGVGKIRYAGEVPQEAFQSGLVTHLDEVSGTDTTRRYYLPVSKATRDREITAYRGLRYSQESLDSINGQPGVQRVHSNGEFTLYYVDTSYDQ